MNGVYATFKDVLTGSKDNTVPPAGIEDTHASGVNEQVSALEQMFAQNIAILKVTIRQREETVKKEAQDAERGFASLRENITMLETKLEETVNSARIKESASQKLEKDLTARNRDLQEELKTNQETLQSRDAEIIDLKSRLLLLSRSIMDMSSFFKQAEGLVSLDQAGGKEVAKEPTNGTEGKPAGAELKRSGAVKSKAADTRPQKVPQEFFDHVTQELTQIIGPMAPMIIHDNVAALGESMEKFPNSRVRELLDSLNKEISEENGKARFRTSFAKQMREGGA